MIGDLGFSLTRGVCDDMSVLASVSACILDQIDRPYPCSARQTLMAPEDLELPSARFRVFFGAFDWHSCVHSHWTLVRLLADGCLDGGPSAARSLGHGALPAVSSPSELSLRIAARLEESFDPSAMAEEEQAWRTRIPDYEERPYGHTWFLMLDAELARLSNAEGHAFAPHALRWRAACKGMTQEMARRTQAWIEGLALPTRSGVHSDTAWSLAMAWDWARSAGNAPMSQAITEVAERLFARDVCAPCAYEPGGDTFTSSILNEAALMARVMPAERYEAWLRGYLPRLFAVDAEGASEGREGRAEGETGRGAACTQPAWAPLLPDLPRAWDGASYLGVHEVALPLSRALAARDAAAALPAGSRARTYLASEARRWMRQGLEGLSLEGYLAQHWLGSFAAAALLGE